MLLRPGCSNCNGTWTDRAILSGHTGAVAVSSASVGSLRVWAKLGDLGSERGLHSGWVSWLDRVTDLELISGRTDDVTLERARVLKGALDLKPFVVVGWLAICGFPRSKLGPSAEAVNERGAGQLTKEDMKRIRSKKDDYKMAKMKANFLEYELKRHPGDDWSQRKLRKRFRGDQHEFKSVPPSRRGQHHHLNLRSRKAMQGHLS
ncbi:unnamed protein product [Allacma fusca]|uniref:Uncharacterized protein n=1 Tax=Allacma fusca TaxID=39272 RepID=A0A8J2JD42_9HEXA|nr:unnamed protein product [Allacma fusca]